MFGNNQNNTALVQMRSNPLNISPDKEDVIILFLSEAVKVLIPDILHRPPGTKYTPSLYHPFPYPPPPPPPTPLGAFCLT